MENNNTHRDDEREPIEDIEKTVEDLKKKIQELDEQVEAKKEEVKESDTYEETISKMDDIKKTTKETVNRSIDEVKKVVSNASNNEDVQKALQFIKENARKAVDSAKGRIDEIKNDPKVQENYADCKKKTSEVLQKGVQVAKEATDNASRYIDQKLTDEQKESIKDFSEKASKVVDDTAKTVTKAVSDFTSNPKVQEFGKNATDMVDKQINALKDFFHKEDKQ